ncbi:MAG: hypothetical protein ACOVP5_01775, partial [Chitinophagales bacterium]
MNTNSSKHSFLSNNDYNVVNAGHETIAKMDAEENLPEILFITSIPPRECGIATYSQDLVNALNTQFGNSFKTSICSLESATERHSYLLKPKMILNIDQVNAFEKTAFLINRDEHINLVVIQHEFGFFASKNEKFSIFIETITKPIAFVFHTVLPRPNDDLKDRVQKKAKIAASIIVMTKDAADILKNDYNIATDKIAIIPHGTHLVP